MPNLVFLCRPNLKKLVLNLTNESRKPQKNLTKTSFQKIVTSLSFFSIYIQFGAIQKPDSGCIACKTFIFIKLFILQNLETELKSLKHSSHTIALSKGTILAKKHWFFAKKMLTSAKLKRPTRFIFWTYMCVITCHRLISSIILKNFIPGEGILSPLPHNENIKSPLRLGLTWKATLNTV